MRKKASAGIPVLGTVAHFLPTLSMMKPAGKIIVKTAAPETVKRKPTCLQLTVATVGSNLWLTIDNLQW